LPYLVKVAIWLTPHKKEIKEIDELHHVKYMDSKFIATPSVALAQAKAEAIRMGQAAQVMYDDVINSLKERSVKKLSKWKKREDALDTLQKEITLFLVNVVQKTISPEESREAASLMRKTNNLESNGDEIENIAELVEMLIEEDLYFSEEALHDFDIICNEVRIFLDLVIDAMRKDDKGIMAKSQAIEDRINNMEEEMKVRHIERLQIGVCAVDPGLIFIDMLTAFEKMGDYCYNIAQAVAGLK